MSELTFEVKEFIEDNINLIEGNAWDEIYDNALFTLDSESTGLFTKAMLDSGIDPVELGGLDYIPSYYLASTELSHYEIPKDIHMLSEGCFSDMHHLISITIPESVSEIGSYVFYDCVNLEEVTCLTNELMIGSQVFKYCPDLVVKCKRGTTIDTYARANDIDVEYI